MRIITAMSRIKKSQKNGYVAMGGYTRAEHVDPLNPLLHIGPAVVHHWTLLA